MADKRKVYPVSVVNRYVKMIMDRDEVLPDIWISGEISNFKRHSSGHLYFSLKDAEGQINAVMFASDARKLRFLPENGKKVQARGAVTLYEKTGGYQLYVRQMEAEGTGDLYLAFERLKQKLQDEGLFAPERKKSIPVFPRKVGIVTSPTGAAVRDIIQIARRRYPGVRLVLYPALVQGEGAAKTIVQGIRKLQEMDQVDVIIVGRGGGSMEDLWPFNEEIVARAIAECRIPIISAVGHETDFTIADFVSDLRAPTPSAAAELAVPAVQDILDDLDVEARRRTECMKRMIMLLRTSLEVCQRRLIHQSPEMKIRDHRMSIDLSDERITRSMKEAIRRRKDRLGKLESSLKLSSPLFPLSKGYAMVSSGDGQVMTSVDSVKIGDQITITMKNGSLQTEVKSKEMKGPEDV